MKKFTKLFAILQAISKAEIKELQHFVRFSFKKRKKNAIYVFELLIASAPCFDDKHPNMQVETVCRLLQVSEEQLNYVVSDLVEILEDYLSYKCYTDLQKTGNTLLPEAYEKRGLTKYIPVALKQTQTKLAQTNQSNDKRLLYRYFCSEMTATYTDDEKKNAAIQAMLEDLEDWHSYQILTTAASILSDKLFNNYNYQLPKDLDRVLQYVAQKDKQQSVLSIYCHIINLLQLQQQLQQIDSEQSARLKNRKKQWAEEEQQIIQVAEQQKKELNQQQTTLFATLLAQIQAQATIKIDPPTVSALREWYSYALNFCYLKYNEGDTAYIIEIFELYELLLAKQLLLNDQKQMDSEQFRNIIKINLQLKRFDFVERFVTDYRRYLSEEVRKDTYHYAMAFLYFARGKYDDVLSYLRRIQFNDISYRVDIDALEIRCYYEKNIDFLLEAKLSSFSLFLEKNKKITATLQAPYKRFVELVKRLWQMRTELDTLRYKEIPLHATPENMAQLKNDIIEFIGIKSWLYEKTAELSRHINS